MDPHYIQLRTLKLQYMLSFAQKVSISILTTEGGKKIENMEILTTWFHCGQLGEIKLSHRFLGPL